MTAQVFEPQMIIEGRYTLDATTGSCGLGELWQARDKNFRNRPVMIEFFEPERADALVGLTQELRAQRSLKHPCVLPVINQGVTAKRPWVAFDGFDGQSLERFVSERRRAQVQVDCATVRGTFDKVLDGVTAAHEGATPVLHGVLHPRCVLVKDAAVRVMDFGVGAVMMGDAVAPFRAPEIAGSVDVSIASDVYSLGALLAELLLPQQVGDERRALVTFLTAIVREPAPQVGRMQRTDVPPAVWSVVARALHREAAARWDDVASMRNALSEAWSTLPASAAPVAAPSASRPLSAPSGQGPAVMRAPTMASAAPGGPAAPLAPMRAPLPAIPAIPAPAPSAPVGVFAPPVPFANPVAAPTNLASSWDWSPSQPLPPPPPSVASAWDAPSHSPSWEAPAPPMAAPVHAIHAEPSSEAEWDDQQTRAASFHAPLDPMSARFAKLASASQESTMALDFDALDAAVGSQSSTMTDDWKDSVVVLNTSTSQSPAMVPQDRGPVDHNGGVDSSETMRPAQRHQPVSAFVPSPSPSVMYANLPANSEATFVASGPLLEAATRPATMAPVSRPPMPPTFAETVRAPLQGQAPALAPIATPERPESKAPVIAAVISALLLIGAAVAFFFTRR